jgi:hypothetical protein
MKSALTLLGCGLFALGLLAPPAAAQNAPTRPEIAIYAGLHEAAAKGDVAEIEKLIAAGEKPNIQDSKSRTPLHVAVYLKQPEAGGERPGDAEDRARRRRQRQDHHQPL